MPFVARLCSATLLGLVVVAPAFAADIPLDYRDFFEKADNLKSFQHLQPVVRLVDSDSGELCAISRAYVLTRKGTERLPLTATGQIDMPLNPEWNESRGKVYATASGDCSFKIEIGEKLPTKTELSYSELLVGIPEFRSLLESQAGLFSSPSLTGLDLVFPKTVKAQAVVQAKAGAKVYTAVDGHLQFPIDDALLKENPTVILSALPDRILPLSE